MKNRKAIISHKDKSLIFSFEDLDTIIFCIDEQIHNLELESLVKNLSEIDRDFLFNAKHCKTLMIRLEKRKRGSKKENI